MTADVAMEAAAVTAAAGELAVPNGHATAERRNLRLRFGGVNYTIKQSGKRKAVHILRDVSGEFQAGRLAAILGPSGAGKTSLLNVLAGFKATGVTGRFELDDQVRELQTFRRMSSYIPQDFVMLPLLTVHETLRNSADLKLARGTSATEKERIIEGIVQLMHMADCRQTLVQHLSGGERKRLSIAIELVTNPPLMFFDEPTSGLDSVASWQVLEHLSTLARQGRVIVCVLHQPGSRLMRLFADILLLSRGQVLYCGPQREMLACFEQCDRTLVCPKYYNPADFALEIGSEPPGSARVAALVVEAQRRHNGETAAQQKASSVAASGDEDEQAAMLLARSNAAVAAVSADATVIEMQPPRHALQPAHDKVGVMQQYLILLSRTFRAMSRHMLGVQLRVVMHIVVALLLGVVFWDIGDDGSKTLTNFSCIFFMVMFVFFANAMPSILLCPQDVGVFIREHLNGWYTLPAYYLAKITAELPMLFVCPTCFMSIAMWMTGQPRDLGRFVMSWGIGLLTGVIGHLIGLIFGSSFPEQMAIFLVPATTIPFLIFSGFFIRIGEIVWLLRPLCDISFFRYAVEGFMQAIYGYGRPDLPCSDDGNAAQCFFNSPERLLSSLGMWGDLYGRDILALLLWITALLVAFYCSLAWRVRRAQ